MVGVRQIWVVIWVAGMLAMGYAVTAQTPEPSSVAETLVLPEADTPSASVGIDPRWFIFAGFFVIFLVGVGVGVVVQRGRYVPGDDAETIKLKTPVSVRHRASRDQSTTEDKS
jgi:hypothetical protein